MFFKLFYPLGGNLTEAYRRSSPSYCSGNSAIAAAHKKLATNLNAINSAILAREAKLAPSLAPFIMLAPSQLESFTQV